MNESTKSETSQTINVSGNAYGFTQEGNIFQSFFAKTDFDEISVEDLESQIKELPEIQLDFFNQRKKQRMLVLGGELGGINKNELILQLAYRLAKDESLDSEKTDSDQTNPQKVDVSIKRWRRTSSQQTIDLEAELQKTKHPTIFVFTNIEPRNIASSLQNIYKIVQSLRHHYILASTDRSFSSWHLNNNAQYFFPTNLNPQTIYGQHILVKELQEELSRYQKQLNKLQEELEKDLKLKLSEYLKNNYGSLESISQNLGSLKSIRQFVKLLSQRLNEHIKKQKELKEQTQLSSEALSTLLSRKNINILIENSKLNDETFIRNLFQNILQNSPRQQLLALGISFLNGLFEDQLFTALEKVFTEAWQKRDPSLVTLDYSDLDELRYNYFDFQENDFDIYERVSNSFKVVETKIYKTDIRLINVVFVKNREQLFKVAWESHRRQIINGLEVLVNIVKDSAVPENYYLPGNWNLYGTQTRREKLRRAVSNTFCDIISNIGSASINALYNSLFELARDKENEVRNVAANILTNLYERGKKEELFRILQFLYDFSLEKEKKELSQRGRKKEKEKDNTESKRKLVEEADKRKLEEVEKQQTKNIITKIKDFLTNLFREEKIQGEKEYYINKQTDLHDFLGATVAVTVGNVISEHYRGGGEGIPDDFYSWLKELSKSKLRFIHAFFGYYSLYVTVPFYLKQMRGFLKEIVEKHKYWLYEEYNLSLNHAVAQSLADAYRYSKNREEVKDILKNWYEEASKGDEYTKSKQNAKEKQVLKKEDALFRTVALTYGQIQYDDDKVDEFPILLRDTRLWFEEILKKDKNLLVRKTIISAVFLLTHNYLGTIEKWLSNLVSDFTPEEQKRLIIELTNIYLKEEVKEELTTVEKVMNKWVKEKNIPAQKIAFGALVSFAKLED